VIAWGFPYFLHLLPTRVVPCSKVIEMSSGIRLAGICCSIVGFSVAIIIARDMPQAWSPFIAIFAGLLGVPYAVNKVKQKLGLSIGNDFTWNERHAMISGWGDGVSLNKSERIPKREEVPECEDPSDNFYAIISREAWYYKVGVGLGRLTWALLIIAILAGAGVI